MATATKAAKKAVATKRAPAAKKAVAAKKVPAKKAVAAKKTVAAKKVTTTGPIKDKFTKVTLATHLAEQTALEPKAVKATLAALEGVVLGAVHKKGIGEFTLPGLLKIVVQAVPAKKSRVGKDPFTGEMRTFKAKPASVRIKVRPLKKLKDAAQ